MNLKEERSELAAHQVNRTQIKKMSLSHPLSIPIDQHTVVHLNGFLSELPVWSVNAQKHGLLLAYPTIQLGPILFRCFIETRRGGERQ